LIVVFEISNRLARLILSGPSGLQGLLGLDVQSDRLDETA